MEFLYSGLTLHIHPTTFASFLSSLITSFLTGPATLPYSLILGAYVEYIPLFAPKDKIPLANKGTIFCTIFYKGTIFYKIPSTLKVLNLLHQEAW